MQPLRESAARGCVLRVRAIIFRKLVSSGLFKAKFIDCAFSIADLRSVLDIPFALYNNNFPEKHKEFLRNITYYKANNIDISNNYKNISLEIDRLYEIEITVNNLYYILPLRYTFDGLTDKGYYEEPSNYNIIISTGELDEIRAAVVEQLRGSRRSGRAMARASRRVRGGP